MKIKYKKTQPLVFAVLAAAAFSDAAAAKVYECTIGGVTVYTSRPSASCRTPDLPKIGKYTSLPTPRSYTPSAATSPAAPRAGGSMKASAPVRNAPPLQTAELNLPKPSGNSGRRSILEQELANERQALNSAQNELSVARAQKNQNRASQLTASIQDRQQNIQALQRELSRM
ncbi:Uncharacterised protein [Kingella potus]|uniref:DUF4124 domain-containing protein n=1 Tax=Kingella potus TaxID=265175 RepID=A0A377R4V8_9NEIS|nr:hypothetical protein [Kingella potus]STR03299.1 Uncharacterised protein [Kingella potus]